MASAEKKKDKKPAKGGEKAAAAKPAAERKPAGTPPPDDGTPYVPRLLVRYRGQVVPALQKRFSYRNRMQVPRLEKITLNVGLGEALQNARLLEAAAEELGRIT